MDKMFIHQKHDIGFCRKKVYSGQLDIIWAQN